MSKRSVILDMQNFAEAVEALAFKMPAPNDWTPQFVQLAQAAARIAKEHERVDAIERRLRAKQIATTE